MEFKKTSKEETKHGQFARLYTQFVEGQKKLDADIASGKNIERETAEFTESVILPLHRLWESLKAEEKVLLERIMAVYEKFGGKSLQFNPFQKGRLKNG